MTGIVRLLAEHLGGMCIALLFGLPVGVMSEPFVGALTFTMIAWTLVTVVPERRPVQ